ncbi:hypothetical protein DPMN_041011 [Dreissena polymorpha]|uniref:Uncharacterized protein n=1 Tax=Dreissena polymorpha TaxID=45954 RepID=A0A9D4HVK9_DREPO|nr:hypothetical protein DPMN_041011 [Dreissena polymorpha]
MSVSIFCEKIPKNKLIVGLQVADQLSCTASILRNMDKPVECQLPLPTEHELYVSERGTIDTNCTRNYTTARV